MREWVYLVRRKMKAFKRVLFVACMTDLATLVFLPCWPNAKYGEVHFMAVSLVLLPLLIVRAVVFHRSDSSLIRIGLFCAIVANFLFLLLPGVS